MKIRRNFVPDFLILKDGVASLYYSQNFFYIRISSNADLFLKYTTYTQ